MADIASLIQRGKPQRPSKFIIMGDPFTGKTTLASKAPAPLFISADGNAAKAGLDAIEATDLTVVRETIEYFNSADQYKTLVVDTIEGIADLFEQSVIARHNKETGQKAMALTDVPYGKLTGQFNRRMQGFSETLSTLDKNVIVLTYTKRQTDDLTGSIVLTSELKALRHFTKFADGTILTHFDGDKYRAQMTAKRTTVGEVDPGDLEPFLKAAGWSLPARKIKVGQGQKK